MPKTDIDATPVQFLLRLPSEMRDWLAEVARENGRSTNSEILARLEKSMVDSSDLETVKADVAKLKDTVVTILDHFNDYELKKPTGRKDRPDRDDPRLKKKPGR